MSINVKPHNAFRWVRADEVAECWNVEDDIYEALWHRVVPHQKEIPNIEDSGPADHVGFECLAKHWLRLSEDQQIRLNEVATKREA